MLMRKFISTLLAVVFVFAMAFTPAFADDTPPPTGGGEQHPWDINDGNVTGGGDGTVNQRPSTAYVLLPGWYGNIIGTALMVASVAPATKTAPRAESTVRAERSIKRSVQIRDLSR